MQGVFPPRRTLSLDAVREAVAPPVTASMHGSLIAPPRVSITFRPCRAGRAVPPSSVRHDARARSCASFRGPTNRKRRSSTCSSRRRRRTTSSYYPDCQFLVIELERAPIGRLYIDRGDDDIRITDIALLPEFRGRGIGRMLMEEILAEAAATRKR